MHKFKSAVVLDMKSDIVIIGAGASGLMAAYAAAKTLVEAGSDASVTVLEKMPRVGRKIMITGKGRCNFTNVKEWNDFSLHIRSKANFVKSAFYALPPTKVIELFEKYGMQSVVERGDRAFPASHHASEVVDTLLNACHSYGVKVINDVEVKDIQCISSNYNDTIIESPKQKNHSSEVEQEKFTNESKFKVLLSDNTAYYCSKLIVCTGGLSYPTTGSTGDGLNWAQSLGHTIVPTFPSLTALVPQGYKLLDVNASESTRTTETLSLDYKNANISTSQGINPKYHIHRQTPLSEMGQKLCGMQLKNVGVKLYVQGNEVQHEFGDLDFTDGGIEGPIGFQISRKAVKALVNGSKVKLVLDMKDGVELTELTQRVKELWTEVDKNPRSRNLKEKEKCRVMLGKLMPWDLIPAFVSAHPEIMTLERKSRTQTKLWVNLPSIAKALKSWTFDIEGYVGYERAVVTAGGVSTDDFVSKTMESRICKGLYMSGEVLDIDADTGGYNLQLAFSTGHLAGLNAAKSYLVE